MNDLGRDVVIAGQGSLTGFDGSMVLGRGLAAACEQQDWRLMLFGFGEACGYLAPTSAGTVRYHAHLPPEPLWWRLHTWLAPGRLARLLQRWPPPRAVVSFSNLWAAAAHRAWPQAPLILRYCGIAMNCARFTQAAGERLNLWQRLAAVGDRATERAALSHATRILVPSPAHADEIIAFAPRTRGRIVPALEGGHPHVGTPAQSVETRRRLGIAPDAFVVLAVGRLDRNKGFDLALQALAALPPHVHLVVAGQGAEQSTLTDLARRLGFNERVHLVGGQADLGPWYAAADCLVSTSHYDTCPNVVKEALANGVPCVVPRHDPPRIYAGFSVVLESAQVACVYQRTVAGLTAALVRLIAEPWLRGHLAQAGRAFAARELNWDATVAHIAELGGLPLRQERRTTRASLAGAARLPQRDEPVEVAV